MPDDSAKIDRMVAEKIMGWKQLFDTNVYMRGEMDGVIPGPRVSDMHSYFSPSTDPVAMMQVISRMRELGHDVCMESDDLNSFHVMFYASEIHPGGDGEDNSLPMAVCLAALEAVDARR